MIQKKSVDKKTDQLIEEQVNLTETKRLIKKIDSNHLMINGVKYEIVQNYKEALAIEVLENRYTEFFEKYDYIVGDLSREALRLRGFYADHQRKVPVDMRISYLEDYLAEFCNFGCPYFVLQRLAPKSTLNPIIARTTSSIIRKKPNLKRNPINQNN